MRRLFVALEMPEEIRDRLAEMQGGVLGANWVDPENFHLTLRFIGEVDGGTAQDILESLSNLRSPAFDLALQGIGHFESRARARALWADVAPEPALLALRRKVEAAVTAAGIEREGRKFKPHVTLARLKDTPLADIGHFEQTHNLFHTKPFAVQSFTLFESTLGRQGPSYRRNLEVPLLLKPGNPGIASVDRSLAES
jgi:2'-5' RNA ligase